MMNESRAQNANTSQTGNGAGREPVQDRQNDFSDRDPVSGVEAAGESKTTGTTTVNTDDSDNSAVADDTSDLQAQLEAAQQTAEDNWAKLVRVQAEMDNLRKRTARDIESAHKYALEKFVNELLPVIDSLELGINAADTSGDAEGLRQGMELTLSKFLDVVSKFGVEEINPLGEKFNPERHEAVSMQESEEAAPGTVITVMQKGYSLNQRLIRPAMVVVAK